jgi:type III secretion system YscQ/HrcQ family protein
MKKEDPYLAELDEIDNFEEEAPPEKVKEEAPEETEEEMVLGDEEPVSQSSEDLLNLAPDIPVQVVVVMGRKSVTVKDLLAMRMGQVVDMDRAPTEPVDLVVGGKLIAKGELVEVDGKLGVRVLKIIK